MFNCEHLIRIVVEISPFHSLTLTGGVSAMAWLRKPSASSKATRQELFPLLQLRVLRFGFFQDGEVGVGVFPEPEKILVSGAGTGSVRVGALRSFRLQNVCSCQPQMS